MEKLFSDKIFILLVDLVAAKTSPEMGGCFVSLVKKILLLLNYFCRKVNEISKRIAVGGWGIEVEVNTYTQKSNTKFFPSFSLLENNP